MSERIDVLAVMAKSANVARINAETHPESRVLRAYAEGTGTARAVVSELVEAAREASVALWQAYLTELTGSLAEDAYAAYHRLDSALARITGEQQ